MSHDYHILKYTENFVVTLPVVGHGQICPMVCCIGGVFTLVQHPARGLRSAVAAWIWGGRQLFLCFHYVQ